MLSSDDNENENVTKTDVTTQAAEGTVFDSISTWLRRDA